MRQPLVSVIIATRRPGFVAGILGMMAAQTYRPVELLLVLNLQTPADLPVKARDACRDAGARVVQASPTATLGECLNVGIAASRGELLAKVDDDDVYGPEYLAEAVEALLTGRGDVIGKAEQYVYLAAERELLVRYPGASGLDGQNDLAGGTLLFPRALGLDPGFPPLSIAEDTTFLDTCAARGLRLYATSRRHYVRRRLDDAHHTWRPEDDILKTGSLVARRQVADDSPAGLIRLVSGR